jgi:hypothetical protein
MGMDNSDLLVSYSLTDIRRHLLPQASAHTSSCPTNTLHKNNVNS